MMKHSLSQRTRLSLMAVAAVGCCLASWAQTQSPPNREEDVSAIEVMTPEHRASIEARLFKLKRSESGMGANHPQLAEVRTRIQELQEELAAIDAVPNPFPQLEQPDVEPRKIIEQLNDSELRFLVVRLAVEVKELRARVARLEAN
jgi:hypothetical protein